MWAYILYIYISFWSRFSTTHNLFKFFKAVSLNFSIYLCALHCGRTAYINNTLQTQSCEHTAYSKNLLRICMQSESGTQQSYVLKIVIKFKLFR